MVDELVGALRDAVQVRLRKRGAVVALSGGIDSSVVLALCARAFGSDLVLGLLLPERESAGETAELGRLVADAVGVATIEQDITPVLEAVGCYRLRDDAFRELIPEYSSGWKAKIVLPPILGGQSFRLFSVVAHAPGGQEVRTRLTSDTYRRIVAATSFKQRVRKMLEYYHADRLDYAVAGTPNRLEYDLGFFVKNGDGASDVKPIAELYKSQVYALAAALGIPEEIRSRTPTTDTYPLAQDQEEFYFALPYEAMDLALYARLNGYPPDALGAAIGVSPDDAANIYADIDSKRRIAETLHLPALVPRPRTIPAEGASDAEASAGPSPPGATAE